MTGLEAIALGSALASTVVSTAGALSAGKAQQQQAEAEAREIEAQSQRRALERRKEGALLESRQRAIAAAQGGAADPSVVRLFGETAAETERAAATELAAGRGAAQGSRYRGQVARKQGKASAFGSLLGGIGEIAGSASAKSAFERFGGSGGGGSAAPSSPYRYGG